MFLVISCPCALVISVPLTFFGGIGGASRCGVLVKGANYLEALARVDTVVFDKTGTLTCGTFEVTQVHPEGISADALLELAALAESGVEPPDCAVAPRGLPDRAGRRARGRRGRGGRPGRAGPVWTAGASPWATAG